MNGYISMSVKETERIPVLERLMAKRIKQKHAAKQLGVSVRQVRRLLKRYKRDKAGGLVHKNRGRASNRAVAREEKDRAIELIKEYYPDFGPTFALEKLKEHHGVSFGVETLRQEMIVQNIWAPKKRKINRLHPYRKRRPCVGELTQIDGSWYAWFEDRGDPCSLIAFIDDATSRIMDGAFVDYEGTFTFFAVTEHYLRTHGKPLALYADKHSTFKVNRQATIEEELRDFTAQSQFGRAMQELRIELIFAHSPQAKGRVERLFGTLQDRLVKEMKLLGIKTKSEGTRYFREVYLAKHNAKFAVAPRERANLHRKLLPSDDLARIFTVQSKRKVSKDLIVQYKNTKYQLAPKSGYRYTLKEAVVMVEENKDGEISIRYKNQVIPHRVEKVTKRKPQMTDKAFKERRVYIPPPDHPWRRGFTTL